MYDFLSSAQIWLKYNEIIKAYCEVELSNHPELIDNVYNETYIALIEAVNSEVGIIEPLKWLMSTAHNIVVMSLEMPSEYLVSNSKNELNDKYLNKMSLEYKNILIRRFRKRYSMNYIAADYGVTEKAVKQRVYRAKVKYLQTVDMFEANGYRPGMPAYKNIKNVVKYLIGDNCVADFDNRIFLTEDNKVKRYNCGEKTWNTLSFLIEKSLADEYSSSEEVCTVYFGEEKTAEWISSQCSCRSAPIINNINRVIGYKAIFNKRGKGYKFKDKPKLIY